MLAAKFNHETPFVMSTFGCQYHGRTPSTDKKQRIAAFATLLDLAGVPVEEYEQEHTNFAVPASGTCPFTHKNGVNGHVNGINSINKTNGHSLNGNGVHTNGHNGVHPEASEAALTPLSHVWLAYWKSKSDFQDWWSSTDVQEFWQSLPTADAGFWRETCAFHDDRSMFETNKPIFNGFSKVGSFCPLGEKTGYWGAYRERLSASTITDPLEASWNGCPVSNGGKPSTSVWATPKDPKQPTIIPERVTIKRFPENLCCVIEGQDRSAMAKREREYWFENFEDLYNEWIQTATLHSSLASDGVVQARMFHDPSSGAMRSNGFGAPDTSLPLALKHNRLAQIIYFQDMSYMERIGRRYSTHLKLRRKFMDAYGPDGDMVDGNIVLWVDLGILKADSISAEYIGCYEGSGFIGYRDHDAFS
ncbi:hypothetical protein SBRCBS47491_009485 [Sporothrix bragantina]|uniref:Phenylacetaldoxime dehydratase n=1 Tax=Sporothrix bragantina TaxID=671064 RepID=A0ABP0CWR5_9PEZI